MITIVAIIAGFIAGMMFMAVFILGDSADLGLTRQALLSDIDYLLKRVPEQGQVKILNRMRKRIEEEL